MQHQQKLARMVVVNQLVIELTGEIRNSNFDEWKRSLIAQVQSIKTELVTDDDFGIATRHVRLLKSAERTLKDAKQSAIEQAADIQNLFAAIDQVAEEARQARLSLERQIRARKQEIKEQLLQSGIETIQDFVAQQNSDFQLLNHSSYLDRNRFVSAAKGKTGTRTVELAIRKLCDQIKLEISQKATEIASNREAIDTLPSRYKPLFQDQDSLLDLTRRELSLTIDKRIALFNEENAKLKAERAIEDLRKLEDAELNPDTGDSPEGTDTQDRYKLAIDICSTRNVAIEIARSIRRDHGDNAAISSIRLTRSRE